MVIYGTSDPSTDEKISITRKMSVAIGYLGAGFTLDLQAGEGISSTTRIGIFLGYTQNQYQIYYCDLETNMVKSSKYVRFDTGMNDLGDTSPNFKQLMIPLVIPLHTDIEEDNNRLPFHKKD